MAKGQNNGCITIMLDNGKYYYYYVDKYFTGIVSRVGGIGLEEISEGILFRHDKAFDPMGLENDETLDSTGFHNLRSGDDKEDHLYNPKTIVALQKAVREGSYELFKEYTAIVDNEKPHTLRGLLAFKKTGNSIPLEEVEPASEIVKRFKTGAMSYGSISKEAHECMAIAMNRLHGGSSSPSCGFRPLRWNTLRPTGDRLSSRQPTSGLLRRVHGRAAQDGGSAQRKTA